MTLETHLRRAGFTNRACGPFTKNKKGIKNIKETGDSRCVHQNELDKSCFQDDMTYGDFKDLTRRTAAYKVLRDKACHSAKNPKYDAYQHKLASTVYKFLDKKSFQWNS